jgi:hypothetical protein
MSTTPHIKPIYAVFCDDIRREVTGKHILIGVYAGDIILPHLPAPVVLSVWVPFKRESSAEGKIPVEFRVVTGDDNQALGYGSMEITISGATEEGALTFPALAMMINRPGALVFQLKQYDELWQTIASLKVGVQSGSPIVSGPSPPSSQYESVAQELTPRSAPSRPARRRRS